MKKTPHQNALYGAWLLVLSLGLNSCGKNAFKAFEEVDPAADASRELENGFPEVAIEILLDSLGPEFTDIYAQAKTADKSVTEERLSAAFETLMVEQPKVDWPNIVSILASAQAQQVGIFPLTIALHLAGVDEGSGDAEAEEPAAAETGNSDKNEITKLFPVLPKPTVEAISGLDLAIATLRAMAPERYRDIERFKEGLFLTSSISLVTKTLDADDDGEITLLESQSLNDASSASIYGQLRAAEASMAESQSPADQETSNKIGGILVKISAQPGVNDTERLRNFLAGSNTTPAPQN